MIGETLLQALGPRNVQAPRRSGVILTPSRVTPPGDGSVSNEDIALLRRYCPAFVIHREGSGDAVRPFPAGRHDYHPRAVDDYAAQCRLLREQRGGLVERKGWIIGDLTITLRDTIVRVLGFFGMWRIPVLIATVFGWLVATILVGMAIAILFRLADRLLPAPPFVGYGLLVAYLVGSGIVLALSLWPFVAERVRRWPTGILEIQAAVGASKTGLPDAVMTPVAILDDRTFWEGYKQAPKVGDRVVYARLAAGPRGWLVAEYWLFYVFNNWLNNHDGDWELAALFFPDRTQAPAYMFLSSHEGGTWREWEDAHRIGDDPDRRAAYVARGSHAMYFEPVEGGHRPTHLMPLSGIPLFGRNLAVRFVADRRHQRDWVPPIEPADFAATDTLPLEIRVLPARVGRSLMTRPELWNRWWWLRFRGSWSRSETIRGPRWQDRGRKWQRLPAFVRAHGVGDLGPFDLS